MLVFALTTRPSFGPLRHGLGFAVGYLAFALALVYAVAPLRGFVGQYFLGDKLRYDAERWLATAVYDAGGGFVGTFDPRLDSQRDVNYTDAAIDLGSYVANPDHKSIPVREVPEHYWQCLVYHEDRHIGGVLNPYGIDLVGVLKIPYTTLTRSIALKRPSIGIGGSTLPMQFARVIYNTPPERRRKQRHQAQAQAEGVVAGARHLPRAHARRRCDAAQAVGRQPHLAGAAHRRRAAARGGDHQPRGVRQGGQGPHRSPSSSCWPPPSTSRSSCCPAATS